MRSVKRQLLCCLAGLATTVVLAQDQQDPEAAAASEVEVLSEAFYEFVPGFPESEWDFDTGEYFSRHAERARGLADGLEFAWSLHARDPELIEELLEFVAISPMSHDREVMEQYFVAMDQSLVVLRMMYDERSVFPTTGPNSEPAIRLSVFGLWLLFRSDPTDSDWNAVEPIILFESDIAFWTHRCREEATGEDEHCIDYSYDGQPHLAVNEFRFLRKKATPRYDLPLRVARLRECADWLDEHGPSVWIAPE